MKYNKYVLEYAKGTNVFNKYIKYNIIISFLIITYPIIMGAIIDAISEKSIKNFAIFISIYTCVSISVALLGYLKDMTRNKLFINIKSKMTKDLFNSTVDKSISFILSNSSGKFAGKIDDVLMYSTLYVRAIFEDIILTLLMLACYILIIAYNSPALGVLLTITSIVYVFFFKKLAKEISPRSSKSSIAKNNRLGFVIDSMTNILLMKSFSDRDSEDSNLKGFISKEKDANNDLYQYKATLDFFQYSVECFILIATILIAGYLLLTDQLSFASFMVIQTAVFNISRRINFLVKAVDLYFDYSGILEAALDTLLDKDDIVDDKDAKKLKITKAEISLKDVSFAYDKNNIFENFNLNIKTNEKVAFIGKSGSGKSSLIALIQRFYDINSGEISIDKQDISKITQNSLREQISYIPQEPSLLSRSIYENIAYSKPNATKEDVLKAAKLANAHDFIEKLDNGYDEVVGERGFKLSGGQKQRIAIARAILKDSQIIIMDEATSALDSYSEKLIQEALYNLMQNKTCIVIAHRLSTIKDMDRIIVLEDGKIVQDGSHLSLVRKKGTYRDLWQLQQDGFIKAK